VEDGVIHIKPGGGDLWTQERFGDFVLDVDVKVDKGTNSGIFIRTDNIQNWLHTASKFRCSIPPAKETPVSTMRVLFTMCCNQQEQNASGR
jgi:hypothetical protein